MGAYTLERSVRYLSVKTRRAWRSFKREYRPTLRTATRLARNGVIFAATAAGLGAAYDYIAHANGNEGLTQGYAWAAVTDPDGCVAGAFIQTHAVHPDEDVALSVDPQPQEGADTLVFDLSGKPLGAGTFRFCSSGGIIFQAINGSMQGDKEIYQQNRLHGN